ncbi:MAG: aminopeptidase [Anaerolineales bacterium]|jgi:aminopeptidase
MNDPRVDKLAAVLVHYSTEVKKDDRVLIQGQAVAEPLLKSIYIEVLKAGGHPFLQVGLPGINTLPYKYASDEQLQYIHEPMRYVIENYDVGITIQASENTKAMSNVDPAKLALEQSARKDLFVTMLQRVAERDFRWVGAQFPTNAHAQDAEMSLEEYADFVFNACVPEGIDPVKYWQDFAERQQKIVDWLDGKKEVHIQAPDTDLTFSIDGRTFQNSDGHENMPDGEIFTSPVKDTLEGHISFSYPGFYQRREVEGVRLWFENGKIVKATADKNEDFLLATLDTDEGSRYIGEFAFGTNQGVTKFTRNTLFDEKIIGTMHLAIGAAFPECGGTNQSSVHWDIVNDMTQGGKITIDGEVMYKDGEFVIN